MTLVKNLPGSFQYTKNNTEQSTVYKESGIKIRREDIWRNAEVIVTSVIRRFSNGEF